MLIYTLWQSDGSADVPWCIDAVDEYTIDEHNGFPEGYAKKRDGKDVRELVIDVPNSAVTALFESPTVKGRVVSEKEVP